MLDDTDFWKLDWRAIAAAMDFDYSQLASGIGVDPGFGEVDDKPLGILAGLEAIAQAADGVAKTLAIAFPGNLCSRAPILGALIHRRVGDNQPVVVIQVGHGRLYLTSANDSQGRRSVESAMTTCSAAGKSTVAVRCQIASWQP
jgi:hypothetical protein